MKQKINTQVIILLTVVNSPSLLAYATCYGQSNSKLAERINWGILTLMVAVYGVLIGFAGFFGYIFIGLNGSHIRQISSIISCPVEIFALLGDATHKRSHWGLVGVS